MFNYYLQEQSFNNKTVNEIEFFIYRLNEIVCQADDYDHFYKNEAFLNFVTLNGDMICDILFTKLTDEQQKRRILPILLRRFEDLNLSNSYNVPEDMNTQYPQNGNAFVGIFLVNNATPINYIVDLSSYKNFRKKYLLSNINGTFLPKFQKIAFHNVIVTDEAIAMAISKGREICKLFEDMMLIDEYISEGYWTGTFSHQDLCNRKPVVISDESDTVKQKSKLKRFRYFNIPNVGGKYCYLHIKAGNLRIHIYPHEAKKIVYVAYIGPHLPTKQG